MRDLPRTPDWRPGRAVKPTKAWAERYQTLIAGVLAVLAAAGGVFGVWLQSVAELHAETRAIASGLKAELQVIHDDWSGYVGRWSGTQPTYFSTRDVELIRSHWRSPDTAIFRANTPVVGRLPSDVTYKVVQAYGVVSTTDANARLSLELLVRFASGDTEIFDRPDEHHPDRIVIMGIPAVRDMGVVRGIADAASAALPVIDEAISALDAIDD